MKTPLLLPLAHYGLIAFLLSGCARVNEVRNITAEIGDRQWPSTRHPKEELKLNENYIEIYFSGEVYKGLGHAGYDGWLGYELSIFVDRTKSGLVINPPSTCDYEHTPIGFIWIPNDWKTVKVELMTMEGFDSEAGPTRAGLTPHPINGIYLLTPQDGDKPK